MKNRLFVLTPQKNLTGRWGVNYLWIVMTFDVKAVIGLFLIWIGSLYKMPYFVAFLIKVTTSRLVQNHLSLTHFSNIYQTSKFFWLIKKVGLTTRNHVTYPKSQSNICLKLSVLESIKNTKQKTNIWELESERFRGRGRYEEEFYNWPYYKNLVKK